LVIGTVSPAAMTLTPALARSAAEAIPAGLSAGTTTVSLLPAKVTTRPSARPASTSFCGLVWSADRKTSAGAPCSICVSSADEESVEMVTVVPGFAIS
jgi:hypothetical protein